MLTPPPSPPAPLPSVNVQKRVKTKPPQNFWTPVEPPTPFLYNVKKINAFHFGRLPLAVKASTI